MNWQKTELVFNVMQESTATFYPGKLNALYKEVTLPQSSKKLDQRDASEGENNDSVNSLGQKDKPTVNMEQMKDLPFYPELP